MDFISIPRDKSGIIAGGMHLALSILIFVFIVPRIMLSLIDKGPTEIGLVVIFAALPICAICILDVYFPLRVKWFLYIGELFSLGILSLITGLLFEFEIDSESLPTMIIFSLLFMVCYNVISSGFHLRTLKGLEKSVKSNQNNLSLLWTTLYLVLPWIIYTIAGIFNRNPISWIFYTIGILALITATFVILSPKSVVSLEKKPRWVKSVGLRIDDFILGLLFGLFVAFLFFGGYYLHPQNIGFAFSGVAIGFWLFSYLTAFNKKFLLVLESTGIFAFVMILQYNWEILGGWWALFGIGLFLGLLFGEISERMSNFSARRQFSASFWQFIIVIFIIGGSFLGYQLKWTVRDNLEQLWLGSLIWLALVIFLFILKLVAFLLKNAGDLQKIVKVNLSGSETTPRIINGVVEQVRSEISFDDLSLRDKKALLAITFCLIVVMPITVGVLYSESNLYVRIDLGKTMYTVDGTPVNVVYLKERSAIILFDSPSPQGIAHTEIIRPAKSIRLGAYFYGLDDSTVADLVDWIGNNMDVFSLGMCGDTVSPANISTIRSINPLVKFYYMAFATTLFEGSGENNSWGGSHYPSMKFNATMHDWTVKLKNGTEAMGVRRDSLTSSAHLMDLGRMEWADYFAWIYSNRSVEFHANGVAIDEVMWRGYWGVDTEDLRDYENLDEIIDTCYAWLERLDSQTDMEIITQAFWPEAQKYQDGCWGEIAFRSGGQYGERVDDRERDVWYEKLNWEGIVRNMVEVSAGNQSYIWAAWYEKDNTEALEYSIATYLMGKPNNCHSLVFHPHPIYDGGYPNNLAGYSLSNVMRDVNAYPQYFNMEMGDALNAMYQFQGNGGTVWRRDFTNGMVLVNPYHAHVPGF